MPDPNEGVTYGPDSQIRNLRGLLRAMLRDVARSRYLAWRLLVRNVSGSYRHTMLGLFGAFIPPLVTALGFILLKQSNVIRVGETPIPYPAFVLLGMTLWECFADATTSLVTMLESMGGSLTKVNFPREALILVGVGQVLVKLLLRCTALIPILVWYHVRVHASFLWAPLGVLTLLVLGTGLGLLLAPMALLFHDIRRGIPIALGTWMLLTPVAYPFPAQGSFGWLRRVNPVAVVLVATRDWIATGSTDWPGGFFLVGVGGLVMLSGSWVLFRLALPVVVERLGE